MESVWSTSRRESQQSRTKLCDRHLVRPYGMCLKLFTCWPWALSKRCWAASQQRRNWDPLQGKWLLDTTCRNSWHTVGGAHAHWWPVPTTDSNGFLKKTAQTIRTLVAVGEPTTAWGTWQERHSVDGNQVSQTSVRLTCRQQISKGKWAMMILLDVLDCSFSDSLMQRFSAP